MDTNALMIGTVVANIAYPEPAAVNFLEPEVEMAQPITHILIFGNTVISAAPPVAMKARLLIRAGTT